MTLTDTIGVFLILLMGAMFGSIVTVGILYLHAAHARRSDQRAFNREVLPELEKMFKDLDDGEIRAVVHRKKKVVKK